MSEWVNEWIYLNNISIGIEIEIRIVVAKGTVGNVMVILICMWWFVGSDEWWQ